MNKRFIVPNKMLKDLGDDRSLRLSNRLRAHRNRIRLFFVSLFNPNKSIAKNTHVERLTYTCDRTTTTPGRLLFDDDKGTIPSGTNKSADAAHNYAKVVDQFYQELFGRVSYDNKGTNMVSSVEYDKNYNNAYWQGLQMIYGLGDGLLFTDFTQDLTVICHEFSHGHTQEICGLYYYGLSGALNEALSDIMGVTCRHWHEQQSDPKTANWLVGDKCVGPKFPGHALRTFVPNEKAYAMDTQPSNMKDRVWTLSDSGGVHTNSKIANVIFYRICQNLNLASYDKPIQIVYKSWFKLKAHHGFKEWGRALVSSAAELYGQHSKEVAAVKKALTDTGL